VQAFSQGTQIDIDAYAGEKGSDQYLILNSEFLSDKNRSYWTAAAPSDKNSEFGIEPLVRFFFKRINR